jgi:retron-type reverse transcriptase
MKANRKFDEIFSPESLELIYEKRVRHARGGGRDHLMPAKFSSLYPKGFEIISEKCLLGKYSYSPYKESLILKGKNKFPRILSIPTVRDRIVLAALMDYLQEIFPESVEHRTPNAFIREIKGSFAAIDRHTKFYRADIKGFYEHVNHELLMQKILSRVKDPRICMLISRALQNPTITEGESQLGMINKIGIPQGLPISNLLAEIFMKDCDVAFSQYASSYFRYVDDVLFVNPTVKYIFNSINRYFDENLPGLRLSREKSYGGTIQKDEINYLGHTIRNRCVSVKPMVLEKLIHSLAKICREIHLQEKNIAPRPHFIKTDEEFYAYYEELLNEKISGIRYGGRLYGWIPYYKEITDLSLLYRMDKILKKLLDRYVMNASNMQINSFVKSYFDIIQKNGGSYIHDFDKLDTAAAQKAFLKRKGWMRNQDYTDDEIYQIYHQCCSTRIREELKNIGYN